MMSRLSTPPLRPAPETACNDVMTTVSSPKVLTSGAVGIRRDKPFPATLLALLLDEPGMVVVHTRDQDWHVVLIAKRRGSAQYWTAFGILWFQGFCNVRFDASENDVETGGIKGLGILHRQVKDDFVGKWSSIPAQRARRPITQCLTVFLPCRTLRGGERLNPKPGVLLQCQDKLLTNNTCGANNGSLEHR